jgi:hypothetical protein
MVKLLRAFSGRNDSEFRGCVRCSTVESAQLNTAANSGGEQRSRTGGGEHLSARSAPQQYRRASSGFLLPGPSRAFSGFPGFPDLPGVNAQITGR